MLTAGVSIGRQTDRSRTAASYRRILDEIKRPFEILGSHAYVGVSIGIALSAKAGVDRHEFEGQAGFFQE